MSRLASTERLSLSIAAAALLFAFCFSALGQSGASPYLGVLVQDISPDRAAALHLGEPRGVEVSSVREGSPAAKAGFQPGDVLLSYNGEAILGGMQLGRLVSETPIGRKVKIQYWRGGKILFASPALGNRVPEIADASTSPVPDFPSTGMDFPNMLMTWISPSLGIEYEPLDEELAHYFGVQNGVLVRRVRVGGLASKAGMKAGDVITRIDAREVTVPRDLVSYIRNQQQHSKALAIDFVRDRKPHSATITIVE